MSHKTARVAFVALVTLLLAGCPPHVDDRQPPPEENPDPNPPVEDPDVIPADVIAAAGHGKMFDQVGRLIELDDEKANEILASMIDVLWKPALREVEDREWREHLEKAVAFVKTEALKPADRVLVRSGIVGQLLRHAPQRLRERYEWRHRLILGRYHDYYRERIERLSELFVVRELEGWIEIITAFDSTYVSTCRGEDVPIPTPWSETGSAWKYHGTLTEKLIMSGYDAHVWTYADPHKRGGCIALPRGDGSPGSAAGIICQSATTGKACFWDNILRGTSGFIGWKGKTLDVNQLQNGNTLAQNCTDCHRGNNVFNISPDDATWAKVIRPAQQSDVGANFTTHVETPAVPRYIPVSTQAGWINPAAAQCIGCHERPAVNFSPPAVMPPACGTLNPADPSGCYGP